MIPKDRAIAALRKAKANPDAFSTDELEMLVQAAEQPDPKPIGDGGSFLGVGDTGMDVLEKNITTPERHAQMEKARSASPTVAKMLGVDAAILRIILVAATLLGFGTGAILYVAAWILMPEEDAAV